MSDAKFPTAALALLAQRDAFEVSMLKDGWRSFAGYEAGGYWYYNDAGLQARWTGWQRCVNAQTQQYRCNVRFRDGSSLNGLTEGEMRALGDRVAQVWRVPVWSSEPKRWHELKADPAVFDAVASGAKTHEIRRNDRGFEVGDGLLLRRTRYTGQEMRDSMPLEFTGEECRRVVSHVLEGYGLQDGWVILSFATAQAAPAEPQSVPDGVWEALQRLIENGLLAGPASAEDARTVAMYRDRSTLLATAQAAPAVPAGEAMLDDLRAQGWAVAVHNDYRLNGVSHTFWLLTKGDRCVKGEGLTDAEALSAIRAALSAPTAVQGSAP